MVLINANKLTLSQNVGGLPDVSAAVMSLLQPVNVGIVTQQMINGYYKPITRTMSTQASIQPIPQELAIKMEGERNWRWHLIHILPNVLLNNNDLITLFGITYKVMKKENWTQYGYLAYFVVENFDNAQSN
jgi:hypothetical protein